MLIALATDTDDNVDSAIVEISVTNTDDESPVFDDEDQGYVFEVSEGAAVGTIAGFVWADDPDTNSSDVSYSIQNTGAPFTADEYGAITVNGALDRATTPSYTFTVRATDSAGLFDQAEVTITVIEAGELQVGTLSGFSWEDGLLDFALDVTLSAGSSKTIDSLEIDLDQDGAFDVFTPYDPEYGGAVITDVDQLDKFGSLVDDGLYPATLKVVYADGTSTEVGFDVEVGNATPQINIAASGSPQAFQDYVLNVTASDPGPDAVEWLQVDWGDGSPLETLPGSSATFSHVYQSGGDRIVVISASDGQDTGYESLYLRVDDSLQPQIVSALVAIDAAGYATLTVEAVDHSGTSLPPGGYVWSGQSVVSASGNTVQLAPGAIFEVYLDLHDSFGGVAYAAFQFEGLPNSSFAVSPFLGGRPDELGGFSFFFPSASAYFEMLYGEKGLNLYTAFTRAGGSFEVVDLWDFGNDAWLSDLDYVDGDQVIQIDESVTNPVQAAQLLYARLYDASAYAPVRAELVTIANADPNDDTAWNQIHASYKAAIAQGAGAAAILGELYASGVAIINEPLDVVISINAGVEGNYVQAGLGLIPFVPSSMVGKGGKVIFKVGGDVVGKFDAAALPFLKNVEKYATLVNTNKWKSWDDVAQGLTVGEKTAIRNFVREHHLIPNIPVNPKTKFADFSSVAFPLPGADANNMVTLPKHLWKAGDQAQIKYLNDTYFFGIEPDGFVWHHHHYNGKMQLVPEEIHNATFHKGGRSPGRWGYPRRP